MSSLLAECRQTLCALKRSQHGLLHCSSVLPSAQEQTATYSLINDEPLVEE